jgi:hypothetical protein
VRRRLGTRDGERPRIDRRKAGDRELGTGCRAGARAVTAGGPGPRLITLCEYLCAFAAEPITERLGCWEPPGPRYSLGATLYASPDGDGDGDEVWLSAEVSEREALRPLLEDWSAARRTGAATVSAVRGALARELPIGPRRGRGQRPDAGSTSAATATPVARSTLQGGIRET